MTGFRYQHFLTDHWAKLGYTTKRAAVANFKTMGFVENFDYIILVDATATTAYKEEYLLTDRCLKKWLKLLSESQSTKSGQAGKQLTKLMNPEDVVRAIEAELIIIDDENCYLTLDDAYKVIGEPLGITKIYFGKILMNYLAACECHPGGKTKLTNGKHKGLWAVKGVMFRNHPTLCHTFPPQSPISSFKHKIFITEHENDFVLCEEAYRRLGVNGESKVLFGKRLMQYLTSEGWGGIKRRCTVGYRRGEWGYTNLRLA